MCLKKYLNIRRLLDHKLSGVLKRKESIALGLVNLLFKITFETIDFENKRFKNFNFRCKKIYQIRF